MSVARRPIAVEAVEPRVLLSASLATLATFTAAVGGSPTGGVCVDANGNAYGTLSRGGAYNDGIVYEVAAGSGVITTLATFNGTNGATPGTMVMDARGNLFGTTAGGGAAGDGTLFELAAGGHTIATLATFYMGNGWGPSPGLAIDAHGDLFGTAFGGGGHNLGTVFELSSGSGVITTLASFNGTNGEYPQLGVTVDAAGNVYGSTVSGGPSSNGAVFEVPAGTGTLTDLAPFGATGVTLDAHGNLFGTTSSGGDHNDGTAFEIAAGTHSVTTRASFSGTDGREPAGGVVLDAQGDLFGATEAGGGTDEGTLFAIAAGSGSITPLASFDGNNGRYPLAALTIDAHGDLYGTASGGGISGNTGTLFELPMVTRIVAPSTPTVVTAGAAVSISAQLQLIDGTLATSESPVVTLSVTAGPSGSSLLGPLSATASNGIATLSNIVFATVGTYTLTLSSPGSVPSTFTVTVAPGAASTLSFTAQPINAVAGQSIGSVAVAIEDAYGNRVTGSHASVSVNLSGPTLHGTLSASAVEGVATFADLTVPGAGVYSLTAVTTGASSATSSPFTVTAATAAKLVVSTQPATVAAGGNLGDVAVAVEDVFGNVVTNGMPSITLSLAPQATGGAAPSLRGTLTEPAGAGTATFADLSLTRTGSYVLRASADGLSAGVSSPFTILPATAAQIAFLRQPTGGPQSDGIGPVAVTIEDGYGNPADATQQAITITADDGALLGNATEPTRLGTATFGDLSLATIGTAHLTATCAGLSATSDAFAVAPDAATAVAGHLAPITLNANARFPAAASGGAPRTLRVTVADEADVGTVVRRRNVRVVDGQAVIGGLGLTRAAEYLVTADDGDGHAWAEDLTVTPSAAVRLAFTPAPASTGTGVTASVDALDRFGNRTAAADGLTVILQTTQPAAVNGRPARIRSFTAVVTHGVATFGDVPIAHRGHVGLTAKAVGLRAARAGAVSISAV